jgi:hypothetical protein
VRGTVQCIELSRLSILVELKVLVRLKLSEVELKVLVELSLESGALVEESTVQCIYCTGVESTCTHQRETALRGSPRGGFR